MKYTVWVAFGLISVGGVGVGCRPTNLGSVSLQSSSSSLTSSSTSNASSTVTAASGVRAAKIIFSQSTGGSFDAPPALGTPAAAGSGHPATRIFHPDNSLMASGGASGSDWPGWLTSFEIGISGSANTSANNAWCATFAGAVGAETGNNCNLGGGTATADCHASANLYRVSEVDCTQSSPATLSGNGSGSDGVYFRAEFNRDTSKLAAHENILVVFEYAATGFNPGPSSPTACYDSGTGSINPETCSDFVWRAYLKHTASETVQPFLLLVPPVFSSVLVGGTPKNSGTHISTKQFVLPLASDSTLKVLQISRTGSQIPNGALLLTTCTSTGTLPGASPYCAGMVLYSITFYRI